MGRERLGGCWGCMLAGEIFFGSCIIGCQSVMAGHPCVLHPERNDDLEFSVVIFFFVLKPLG